MFIESLEDRRLLAAAVSEVYAGPVEASAIAAADLPSPEVSIPDVTLRRNVRRALDKPNGPITRRDMLRLTRLVDRIYFPQVASLEGLQYARNLRVLDAGNGGDVADLSPIAGLVKLERLDLAYHRVKDLRPLAGLPRLKDLNLTASPAITDLSWLRGLRNLRKLILDNVRAEDLSAISHVVRLEELEMSGTFDDLRPLARLRSLHDAELWARFTDVSPLGKIPSLRRLQLIGAFDTAAPLGGLRELRSLALSSGRLRSIEGLQSLDELRALAVNSPRVRSLSPAGGMSRLRSLYAVAGKVHDLTGLSRAGELRSLQLSDNLISDVSDLLRLQHLEAVDLAGNRIRFTTDTPAFAWVQRLRARGVAVKIDDQQAGPKVAISYARPQYSLIAEPLDLGMAEAGEEMPPARIRVANDGFEPLLITAVRVPEGVEIVKPLPRSIDAGGAAELVIRYESRRPALFYGKVLIETNDGLGTPMAAPVMARVTDGDGRVPFRDPTGNVYVGTFRFDDVFPDAVDADRTYESTVEVLEWARGRAVLRVDGETFSLDRTGHRLRLRRPGPTSKPFFEAFVIGDTIIGTYGYFRIEIISFEVLGSARF